MGQGNGKSGDMSNPTRTIESLIRGGAWPGMLAPGRAQEVLKPTGGDMPELPPRLVSHAAGNEIEKLEYPEVDAIRQIILWRFTAAKTKTDEFADKQLKWEKQYNGEWQDATHVDKDHIFLTKTREDSIIIKAYLIQLFSQLDRVVECRPKQRNAQDLNASWERAKLSELIVNTYFNEEWHFTTDFLPRFLNQFVKSSLAVVGVLETENTDGKVDLKPVLVDRANIFVDPFCHDLRHAKWLIYREFIPRSEVAANFERGTWIPVAPALGVPTSVTGSDDLLRRLFGNTVEQTQAVPEDMLLEVWHYYQGGSEHGEGALEPVYAVMVGGEMGVMCWYGDNPFIYKGIPFRGKAYEPHEWQVDGTPFVELKRPTQEAINTALNLRFDDVRENMLARVAVPSNLIDDTTVSDMNKGNKFVRLAAGAWEALISKWGGNGKLAEQFFPLPIGESTQTLLSGDLPLLLGQDREISQVGDVMRGQVPRKSATLGEVTQVLESNQGVFRPIMNQLMRICEEITEILIAALGSPEFFGQTRVVTVVGRNRYDKLVSGWKEMGKDTGVFSREVAQADFDPNVLIDCVSGAKAMMERQLKLSSIQQWLTSIGQIPELFNDLKDKYDFSVLLAPLILSAMDDPERAARTPEQILKLQQDRQIAADQDFQRKLSFQQQTETMHFQARETAKGQRGIAEIQAQSDAAVHEQESASMARISEEVAKTRAEMMQIVQILSVQQKLDLAKMQEQAKLDIKVAKAGGKGGVTSPSDKPANV